MSNLSNIAGAREGLLRYRFARASLLLIALLALSSSLSQASLAAAKPRPDAAMRFVLAANRGDFRTACRLYSGTYLKVSQADCQALYRWGVNLHGRFDYRIVARQKLAGGHWYRSHPLSEPILHRTRARTSGMEDRGRWVVRSQ